MADRPRPRPRSVAGLPCLVIMAKSPRLGLVKRRLATEIGGSEALRFYRASLTKTALRLAADRRWRTILAITPDRDIAAPFWPRARFDRMPQGPGDLGHRMLSLFEGLQPAPVLIVGSDIPGIERGDIAHAFRLLEGTDAVLGPATDGGYWLIGLKPSARTAKPFANVRWSGPHALADTLANLKRARIAFAATRKDVDNGQSCRELRCMWQRLIPRKKSR